MSFIEDMREREKGIFGELPIECVLPCNLCESMVYRFEGLKDIRG